MKRIILFCFVSVLAYLNCFGQLSLTLINSSFIKPVDIKSAGDARIFVVEQAGFIRIMDTSGNVNPKPFLNISSEILSGGEQGLLGLAFSPDYKNNGRFYVNYTDLSGHSHICRFNVSATNPDSADPASEETIFYVTQPYSNHNGGNLEFGGDGYLYCAFGDGGSGGDPGNRAQNLQDTLGKILRIDVDVPNGYRIPPDNPFYGDTAAVDEIWAYGLRNPWRNSFDRITHDYWIADVGQGLREEVNFQPASSAGGENYGWRCYEGNLPFNLAGCGPTSNYVFPLHDLPHSGSFSGCSVTGGYVYRGAKSPTMFGKYFFTDWCTNRIYSITRNDTGYVFVQETMTFWTDGFATFGEDVYGEIYVAGTSSGKIYRLGWNDCTPVAFITFEDTIKVCNGSAMLTALYHPTLTYQWKRDGKEIFGEISHHYTANLAGYYSVVVSNDTCVSESDPVYLDNCIRTENDVVVAPNPASNEINLLIRTDIDGQAAVNIYDIHGRLCISKLINLYAPYSEKYKINIASLSAGLYIIKVNTVEFAFQGKFIVAKTK